MDYSTIKNIYRKSKKERKLVGDIVIRLLKIFWLNFYIFSKLVTDDVES